MKNIGADINVNGFKLPKFSCLKVHGIPAGAGKAQRMTSPGYYYHSTEILTAPLHIMSHIHLARRLLHQHLNE